MPLTKVPSRALLRTFNHNLYSSNPATYAGLTRIQRRYESTKEGESKPNLGEARNFKSQLFDTAARRIEKDRATEIKYAELREEHKGGRSWAITFGE
jgi:hypothetical protein